MAKKTRQRRRAGSDRRDTEHQGGGEWQTLRLPEGVDIFKPKEGTYRLDIVPYIVGDGNPYADAGYEYYERTFHIYRDIGPEERQFVAPSKLSPPQPDPIAEEVPRLRRDGQDDLAKALAPKERQLFLVYDHDDADKGVQLWEVSHHLFGKLLDKRRKTCDEDEGYIREFDDPDAGATLRVTFEKVERGGYKFLDTVSIDFKPRPKGLQPASLLDHGVCLDDLVKVPTYQELKDAYHGVPTAAKDDQDDDPAPAPSRGGRKPKADKPAASKRAKASKPKAKAAPTAQDLGIGKGDTVDHPEHGLCDVVKVSPDGTSLTLLTADDDMVKAVSPADVKLADDDAVQAAAGDPPQDDPAPAKDDAPADDGDDWDDDWDDEEPAF